MWEGKQRGQKVGEVGLQCRYSKASASPFEAVKLSLYCNHWIHAPWAMGPGLGRGGSLHQRAISKGRLTANSTPNVWRSKSARLERGIRAA